MIQPRLSDRSGLLKPSPTLSITAKAKAMKAQGEDVLSFAAGEPDFNTPDTVCQAAIEALNQGFTKYTPSSGIPELKDAIVGKLQRENGLGFEPSQIVVGCGAKHSIYNSMMTLLNPGDEAILIAPYWMTYADQIRLAGAVPVVVKTDLATNFVPAIEAIQAKITPRTRLILVNSPSNPTGAVYPRKTLEAIAELALRHNLWIVSDEIYERLVYGTKHESVCSLGKEVQERTVLIGGCSKTYAMTGWRIGFAAAPKPVASAMSNFQDQVTSNPTSFAQKGAIAAFNMDASGVEAMRVEFEARRDLFIGKLRQIEGLGVPTPMGAFYVFANVSRFLRNGIATDVELANYLLEEAKLATVPGSVFEGEDHLRMSYACSREDLSRGAERLGEALSKLK